MEILGYCNMNFGDVAKLRGWDQVYEFQVINGFAYCSHGGNGNRGLSGAPGTGGFSIVDVRNPRNMKVIFRRVNDSPAIGGPNDNSQYLDIKDHIMVLKRNRSLEMWDVRNPFAPVRLSSPLSRLPASWWEVQATRTTPTGTAASDTTDCGCTRTAGAEGTRSPRSGWRASPTRS